MGEYDLMLVVRESCVDWVCCFNMYEFESEEIVEVVFFFLFFFCIEIFVLCCVVGIF